MSRPTNERPQLPRELTVGDPAVNGQLRVGLRADGTVWVNASRGTGVLVDLSVEDEALLRRWLTDVGRRRRNANR